LCAAVRANRLFHTAKEQNTLLCVHFTVNRLVNLWFC